MRWLPLLLAGCAPDIFGQRIFDCDDVDAVVATKVDNVAFTEEAPCGIEVANRKTGTFNDGWSLDGGTLTVDHYEFVTLQSPQAPKTTFTGGTTNLPVDVNPEVTITYDHSSLELRCDCSVNADLLELDVPVRVEASAAEGSSTVQFRAPFAEADLVATHPLRVSATDFERLDIQTSDLTLLLDDELAYDFGDWSLQAQAAELEHDPDSARVVRITAETVSFQRL